MSAPDTRPAQIAAGFIAGAVWGWALTFLILVGMNSEFVKIAFLVALAGAGVVLLGIAHFISKNW